jgi:diamine N-acetyltransferase
MMITGNKIKLRALEPTDADLLYQWENDHKLWHISNTLAPISRFVIEQYILDAHLDIYQTRQLRLMIDDNKDDTIGAVDLFDFEPAHRRLGIGIYILEKERKKGIASEALDLLIAYCFNTLMIKQIYCNITPDNTTSIALFEKKGFRLIGNKKSWLLVNNTWKDEYLYQLINNQREE